jgi:hypothetical protein
MEYVSGHGKQGSVPSPLLSTEMHQKCHTVPLSGGVSQEHSATQL